MKVLFYGGCHASALARIFRRYNSSMNEVEHLTNFLLIRKNTPVPYDYIKRFDWIIFSPILNKGQWNTSHIETFCQSNGIRFIKFPWLQWNGYFPSVVRADYPWYAGWIHGKLLEASTSFASFEAFREHVIHGDALGEDAVAYLAATTNELRNRETRGGVDIRISDFVEQNYRTRRLFLIPDHPSNEIYKYIVPLIAERMGVKLDESFLLSTTEIQSGVQLPILPAVARTLELGFSGADFEHHEFFGKSVFTLTEYLRIIYHKPEILRLSALTRTYLRSADDPFSEPTKTNAVALAPKRRVLVRKLNDLPGRKWSQFEIYGEDSLGISLQKPVLTNADWELVKPAPTQT